MCIYVSYQFQLRKRERERSVRYGLAPALTPGKEPHSATCEVKGPAVWLFGSFQSSRRVLLGVESCVCQDAASEQDSDDADEHPNDDFCFLDER